MREEILSDHQSTPQVRAALQTANKLIADYGLSSLSHEIRSVLSSCILARTRRTRQQDIPLGATRLGGAPDLPAGFPWPTNAARPLLHVAQINLKDLARVDLEQQLPTKGWLCFWVLCDDSKITNPHEPISQVAYIEPGTELVTAKVSRSNSLSPCRVSFGRFFCLPYASQTPFVGELGHGDRWDLYADLDMALRSTPIIPFPPLPAEPWWKRLNHFGRPHYGLHQMFGDPQRVKFVPPEYKGQVLLLQARSDDELDSLWTWGEGSLCYYIRPEDLQRRAFETVEMLMDYGD